MTRILIAVAALCAAPPFLYAQDAHDVANGVFLVAQPSLADPNFSRTVVLITQPPLVGPIGVIINRPTAVPLREVFPQYENIAALPQTLHVGGPVGQQGLLFLVRAESPPPRSIPVLRDVYLLGDAEWVDNALKTGNVMSAIRVFAGHSGWARGQLHNELEREGWYVLPADSATVFEMEAATIWPELVKRAVLRPTTVNKRHDYSGSRETPSLIPTLLLRFKRSLVPGGRAFHPSPSGRGTEGEGEISQESQKSE